MKTIDGMVHKHNMDKELKAEEVVKEIETLLDFGEWEKAKTKIRELASRDRKIQNPAYVTALEALCKEMAEAIVAHWRISDEFGDHCAHCGSIVHKFGAEITHLLSCPVLKAEEYLKGLTP